MYHVCALATRRDPAATLIKALEGEGLSCSVVRDIQALSTDPTDGKVDAVLLDGSACDLQDVPPAGRDGADN